MMPQNQAFNLYELNEKKNLAFLGKIKILAKLASLLAYFLNKRPFTFCLFCSAISSWQNINTSTKSTSFLAISSNPCFVAFSLLHPFFTLFIGPIIEAIWSSSIGIFALANITVIVPSGFVIITTVASIIVAFSIVIIIITV